MSSDPGESPSSTSTPLDHFVDFCSRINAATKHLEEDISGSSQSLSRSLLSDLRQACLLLQEQGVAASLLSFSFNARREAILSRLYLVVQHAANSDNDKKCKRAALYLLLSIMLHADNNNNMYRSSLAITRRTSNNSNLRANLYSFFETEIEISTETKLFVYLRYFGSFTYIIKNSISASSSKLLDILRNLEIPKKAQKSLFSTSNVEKDYQLQLTKWTALLSAIRRSGLYISVGPTNVGGLNQIPNDCDKLNLSLLNSLQFNHSPSILHSLAILAREFGSPGDNKAHQKENCKLLKDFLLVFGNSFQGKWEKEWDVLCLYSLLIVIENIIYNYEFVESGKNSSDKVIDVKYIKPVVVALAKEPFFFLRHMSMKLSFKALSIILNSNERGINLDTFEYGIVAIVEKQLDTNLMNILMKLQNLKVKSDGLLDLSLFEIMRICSILGSKYFQFVNITNNGAPFKDLANKLFECLMQWYSADSSVKPPPAGRITYHEGEYVEVIREESMEKEFCPDLPLTSISPFWKLGQITLVQVGDRENIQYDVSFGHGYFGFGISESMIRHRMGMDIAVKDLLFSKVSEFFHHFISILSAWIWCECDSVRFNYAIEIVSDLFNYFYSNEFRKGDSDLNLSDISVNIHMLIDVYKILIEKVISFSRCFGASEASSTESTGTASSGSVSSRSELNPIEGVWNASNLMALIQLGNKIVQLNANYSNLALHKLDGSIASRSFAAVETLLSFIASILDSLNDSYVPLRKEIASNTSRGSNCEVFNNLVNPAPPIPNLTSLPTQPVSTTFSHEIVLSPIRNCLFEALINIAKLNFGDHSSLSDLLTYSNVHYNNGQNNNYVISSDNELSHLQSFAIWCLSSNALVWLSYESYISGESVVEFIGDTIRLSHSSSGSTNKNKGSKNNNLFISIVLLLFDLIASSSFDLSKSAVEGLFAIVIQLVTYIVSKEELANVQPEFASTTDFMSLNSLSPSPSKSNAKSRGNGAPESRDFMQYCVSIALFISRKLLNTTASVISSVDPCIVKALLGIQKNLILKNTNTESVGGRSDSESMSRLDLLKSYISYGGSSRPFVSIFIDALVVSSEKIAHNYNEEKNKLKSALSTPKNNESSSVIHAPVDSSKEFVDTFSLTPFTSSTPSSNISNTSSIATNSVGDNVIGSGSKSATSNKDLMSFRSSALEKPGQNSQITSDTNKNYKYDNEPMSNTTGSGSKPQFSELTFPKSFNENSNPSTTAVSTANANVINTEPKSDFLIESSWVGNNSFSNNTGFSSTGFGNNDVFDSFSQTNINFNSDSTWGSLNTTSNKGFGSDGFSNANNGFDGFTSSSNNAVSSLCPQPSPVVALESFPSGVGTGSNPVPPYNNTSKFANNSSYVEQSNNLNLAPKSTPAVSIKPTNSSPFNSNQKPIVSIPNPPSAPSRPVPKIAPPQAKKDQQQKK